MVYTAIYGNHDRLHPVPESALRDRIDFVCFTDDPAMAARGWQVRLHAARYPHPRMAAKYFRALPHIVLPEYEETLWVDGSFSIRNERLAREAFACLEGAGIALFQHPDRNCIYDEAEVSKTMLKYADQDIDGQVAHYRGQGYPEKHGLFATGIMARRRDDPAVRRLNEMWLEENVRFTYQDQLSLPFVLWKLDIRPAIFRQHLWRTRWGRWNAHAHDV